MFTLTINTDSAAFATDDGETNAYARDREIARILRKVAKNLEDGGGANADGSYLKGLFDSNGNRVGQCEIK